DEADTDRLHELSRRYGSEARDDAMTVNRALPFLRRNDQPVGRSRAVVLAAGVRIVRAQAARLGVHEAFDPARADRARDLRRVGVLGARKAVAAIEQDH